MEASQFRAFIDTTGGLWGQGKLVNKVVSAMSSAQNSHGGQEATVLSIYKTMAHWGAIIVPPGYTDPVQFASGGNPYGVSATAGEDGIVEDIEEAVKHQAKRTVETAKWIKDGQGKGESYRLADLNFHGAAVRCSRSSASVWTSLIGKPRCFTRNTSHRRCFLISFFAYSVPSLVSLLPL